MTTSPMKSNRGRPPSAIRKDDIHASIDQDVALFWRLQNVDPLTGKTKVGALSELINRLLREEMNRQIKAQP